MYIGMQLIKILSLLVLLLSLHAPFSHAQTNTTFQIGVILDAESLSGPIGLTSLSLALSDFYAANANFTTRLQLHVRDSRKSITGAAASALNLLQDVRVDAIIGPQTSSQANFVIGLGNTSKVPIISFSATSPSLHPQTPYFVQTALNDAAQVNAIASIVSYFRWNQVVLVYEDSDYGNGITPYLSNAFQEANARVSYRSVIPVSASDDLILRELYKMKTMQTRVFVVHLSTSLASKFFVKAKEADMMSQGYAWIVTSVLMDLFFSMDSQVVDSMQGVLGVKPLIPASGELRNTTLRWKAKFSQDYPSTSQAEMGLIGLWAYDTLWALAMAAERVGFRENSTLQTTNDLNFTNMFVTEVSQTGPKLLEAMLGTTFEGLGGRFRLVNGQLEPSSFQILNVVGKGLKEIGIWTPTSGKRSSNEMSFSGKKLKDVVWPGGEGTTSPPRGWQIPVSGRRLRVGVPSEAGFPEFVNVERDPQTNATKITGYYIDLFDSVMAALPYDVLHDYVAFDTTDGPVPRSYDDLSYQVFDGALDAAVGDITITFNRSQFVDFSLPIEEGGITRIQIVEYDDTNKWNVFLEPLEKQLWLTALALFIFTGLALWILEHKHNEAFRGPPSEHVGLILYIPFMSVVFANRERIVTNLARVVVVMWVFVVMILASTYTASLSAKLTTWKLQDPQTDIKSLRDGGENVGCREGSFIASYLKNTLHFDETKIKTYEKPDEINAALQNGTKKRGIKAFFSGTPYTNLFMTKYCNEYMKVGSPYLSEGFAFVFPRGSPLVADVSRAVVQLTDSGRLAEIKSRWIRDSECYDNKLNLSDDAWESISLNNFKVLFGITGGITAACLVVFLATYLYQHRDFIQRISSSGATTWSKIRALGKHFDQRDPNSFRAGRDKGDGDPNASPDPARWSTVVQIPLEEMPSENRVVGPDSNNSSTTATATATERDGDPNASQDQARWSTVVPIELEEMPSENRVVDPNSDNSSTTAAAAAEEARSV